MARLVEYTTPRVQVLIRLQPRDLLIVKTEARHLGISVNRLIERAIQDWIARDAGAELDVDQDIKDDQ
jgi:predicted DNA binding CopG/RHH family protein